MIKRLILALAVMTTSVSADPDRISILLGSKHLGGEGFNESNLGVFLTWEKPRVAYSTGVFHNSFGRPSIAATVDVPVIRWDGGQASLFGGVAYYPEDGRNFRYHVGDLVPIGGVQVRHGNAFAQIIPSDGRAVDAIVSFGFTTSLE